MTLEILKKQLPLSKITSDYVFHNQSRWKGCSSIRYYLKNTGKPLRDPMLLHNFIEEKTTNKLANTKKKPEQPSQ